MVFQFYDGSDQNMSNDDKGRQAFESLREFLLDSDKVEEILVNAFTKNLNIDDACHYITSKFFRKSIQRLYSVYDLKHLKMSQNHLAEMNRDFIDLLAQLLKLHFISYSGQIDKMAFFKQLRTLDEQMIIFLKRNTIISIQENESAFSVVYRTIVKRMLEDRPETSFLSSTKANDYNRKISELMLNLFQRKDFLKDFNTIYDQLLHTNMLVFNSSKFFKGADMLSRGFQRFTQKRFERVKDYYGFLAEYYTKHGKLLYSCILLSRNEKLPPIEKIKRWQLLAVSSKISEQKGFEIFSVETSQIRNAIKHDTAKYDSTKGRCIFDDHDHGKEPIYMTGREFENITKELLAKVNAIAKVSNFNMLFYFVSIQSLLNGVHPFNNKEKNA